MFTEKTNASTYGNNVFPLETNDLSLFLSRNKSGKNLPRITLNQRDSIQQQQPKYLFPNSYSLGENKSSKLHHLACKKLHCENIL